MKINIRIFIALLAVGALSIRYSRCAAADVSLDSDSDGQISVQFATGKTEIATMSEGVHYFFGRTWPLQNIPPEIAGLQFTRRTGGKPAAVVLDVQAGATVYLLVDGDTGPTAHPDLNKRIAASGWTRLADAQRVYKRTADGDQMSAIAVYRQEFASPQNILLDGGGWAGIVVAGKNLQVKTTTDAPPQTDANKDIPDQPLNVTLQNEDTSAPTTQISKNQSEIKALEILEQDDGTELGEATEFILTAEPGSTKGDIPVSFGSEIGPQTKLVLAELMRWVHVTYPRITGTNKLEYSFEDKYIKHDGGSIGAACGTLLLSVVQGFDVDPNLAMTGDVTADGKVRAIGGVAAKLRGAAAAGCTLVALPDENYEQLVDAEIYDGLSAVTNTQVLGISTLDSAAAVARVDRDAKLAQAITLFSEIQEAIKQSPDYLKTTKAQSDLQQVLDLDPDHLSAKVLLSIAQGTARTRLTAGASEYYTFVAVQFAVPMINQQIQSGTKSPVLPAMVEESLKRLLLVHQRSDPHIVPLIDAWSDWIQASSDYESGNASDDYLETKRQAALDAMTKLQANRDLIEKMLHEGM
ncbi:MAG: S16 family serine protease [Tepidisphaeraceae bacterium]